VFPVLPQSLRYSWISLALVSLVLALILSVFKLPAGTLLACMLAGMLYSARGAPLRIQPRLFVLAQGLLGCLIAKTLELHVLAKVASDWPIFLSIALCVLASSSGLGWLLMRSNVLPGTTAIWGLAPGAASAMVLMAEDYGADVRLVAFMQYLRVVIVTAVASLVAHLWVQHTAAPVPQPQWHFVISPLNLALTLLIAFGGATSARLLKLPGGPLLVPMVLAIAFQNWSTAQLELPHWLLSIAYAMIGWSIGLRFSPATLSHAWRVLPRVLASIFALIAISALLAVALSYFVHFEPLTAYLATSPGGADSVAVIAATSSVDAGFVMAMQMVRFLMVLAFGPPLSRFLAHKHQSAQTAL
jgi:membrane AbrB-like protein